MKQPIGHLRAVRHPSSPKARHGNRTNRIIKDIEFMETLEEGQIWYHKNSVNKTEILALLRDELKVMVKHHLHQRVSKIPVSRLRTEYGREN